MTQETRLDLAYRYWRTKSPSPHSPAVVVLLPNPELASAQRASYPADTAAFSCPCSRHSTPNNFLAVDSRSSINGRLSDCYSSIDTFIALCLQRTTSTTRPRGGCRMHPISQQDFPSWWGTRPATRPRGGCRMHPISQHLSPRPAYVVPTVGRAAC